MIDTTGKILIIGPSRAGKSYFARAFKAMGLPAIDLDADTELAKWRSDDTGEPVERPSKLTHSWMLTHHFRIIPEELDTFLSQRKNLILFGHCWNIMDVLEPFDHVLFMDVPIGELEHRLRASRDDHKGQVTSDELEFFRKLHQDRRTQALARNIPLMDATQTPEAFYRDLMRQVA